MKIIFRARDLNEAHIISGLLNANGIDNHVGGHYLQGGIGELAAADFITVHVADDDVDAAAAIIAEYEGNIAGNHIPADDKTEKTRNSYITPLLVIALSLLLIIVLTILFSSQ